MLEAKADIPERSEGIRANGEGCDRGLNGVETEGLTRQGEGRSLDEVPPLGFACKAVAGKQKTREKKSRRETTALNNLKP